MTNREVLIVEDKGQYRDSIKRAFKRDRYFFFEAGTVRDGIDLLEKNRNLRVIILDLSLPDDSGVELLTWLKPRAADYRVIVLTGHEELLKAEGATEFAVFYYQAKATRFSVQSIRFAVDQAFKDLENEKLKSKLAKHLAIQKKINANDPLDEILSLVCDSVLELVDGYTCHIRVFDLQKGDYVLRGYDGPSRVQDLFSYPRKLSGPFSGRVARTNRRDIIKDLQADPEFLQEKELLLLTDGLSQEIRDYLENVASAYIVPVSTAVFENEVDAVFNINSVQKAFFSPDLCRLVDEFVNEANVAIAKDWLRNKREEVHRDYNLSSNLLVEISEQLKGVDILENIYGTVMDAIIEIIKPEMISIFLYNERSGLLEKVAEQVAKVMTEALTETYEPGESLTGKVFASGTVLSLNKNPTEHPDFDPRRKEIDLRKLPSRQIRHYLGVPLKAGNKVIGVIRAVNKRSGYYEEIENINGNEDCLLTRGFSNDCQTLLRIIASHLSVTIKNAELFNKLSGTINQLQTLTEVARKVSSNYEMDTEELLQLIVEKTAEVTNSVICMLFLKDEHDQDRLVLKQAYGIPESKRQGIFYAFGEGKTGMVAQTGESTLEIGLGDFHIGKYDSLILQVLKDAEGEDARIESYMAVPVIIDESQISGREVIGVLKVINKKQDHLPFDKSDVKIFETFASQIALALAIAGRSYALTQLVGGVNHEIHNTSTLIPPTVSKIRELLNQVDPEVDGRLTRVSILAKQAVEFANDLLGFSESRMQDRKPMDINLLVEEALDYFSPDTLNIDNFEQVTILRDLSRAPISCDVNETPLVHIFRNVITNAYHALEEKNDGLLEIRTYVNSVGKVAHIEFSDNGIGIKKEHLANIFRSDFSTKKGLKRNGLGLWLVKTYLRRMGGSISVRSEHGVGSIFTIRFPISKQDETADD